MSGLGAAVVSGTSRVGRAERTSYNGARRKMFIVTGGNLVVVRFGSQFRVHEYDISRKRVQGKVVLGNDCYIGSSGISNSGTVIKNKLRVSGTVVGWTNLEALSQLIPLKQNESAYVKK